MKNKVNVFIVSAPKDESIFQKLEKHLATLKRGLPITVFHEKKILAGQKRLKMLNKKLKKADIVLVLFSSDLTSSDFYYEMANKALKLQKCTIPILVRSCSIDRTPFGDLQSLPKNGQYIVDNNWSSKDEPFVQIIDELAILIEELINKKNKIKTSVVRLTAKIGNFIPQLTDNEVEQVLTNYIVNEKHTIIHFNDFDKLKNIEYWEVYTSQIMQKIAQLLKKQPSHISIFGFAPIPLLMFLGSCIGDKIPTSVFPTNRDTIPSNRLIWLNNDDNNSTYFVRQIQTSDSLENVAVLVALSDYIKADKYNTVLDTSFSIYEITIDKPSKYFLKNEKQLVYFAHEFCDLLNEIQAIHGRNTPIHLLTAIPTAISIKIGLTLLPTKDQPIHIYDYSPQKGFQKVIIL